MTEKINETQAVAKRAKDKKIADVASKAAKSGPRVAKGKSITSRRGILDSMSGVVTPADFPAEGEKRIKELLDKGVLVQ